MAYRSFHFIALGLLLSVALVSAQPGPLSTPKNNSLALPASTLLTNGLPGLSGSPANLMIASVQTNSAEGSLVSLMAGQTWERRYNGAISNEDQAQAIVADKDGNIIVGGYSLENFIGSDFLTIKYTPDGTGVWTNHYDGPDHGQDHVKAVAVDGSGGVYVSGEGGSGIVTIKYTAEGIPVWTNNYSSTNFLSFTDLAVDNDGNAYMIPFDMGSDSYITVKYDVNGQAAWTNFFRSSPTSTEFANSVAVDAAGNIFVTGESFNGTSAALTIKYASDGSILWIKTSSLVGLESGDQVIVDQQGNVVIVGDSQGGTAQHKYFVVKYSNQGTLLWTNIVAAADYVGGGVPEITTDPPGNVFLVGATPGAGGTTADYTTTKFSNTGQPVWTNRFVEANAGTPALFGAGADNAGNVYWSIESAAPGGGANYNYVTLKYASNGVPVWTNRYNGAGNSSDTPRAMTVDKAGAVYVTGASSSGGTSFSALDWATVKYSDTLRYTPPVDFVGADTITFTAFDSSGNSATGTVTVNVLPGPVAAPDNYATVAGNTQLNTLIRSTNNPRTYQMQFTPDALGGLPVGARVTGLRFRLSTNSPANFPSAPTAWSDYEVTLAQAANPITAMSPTFQANFLNPVLVKNGPLSIGANFFSTGANPNPFATMIAWDTPYIYQGGDLVMQFMLTGSDSTNNTTFLDAASTAAPGYGTSFRAFSASTFAASSGIAASVTIVGIVFTPTITQTLTHTANQLILNGSGGLTGGSYQILTTTNLALPINQWTPIATNQFGTNGGFNFTNVILPNVPGQYFRVMVP